MKRSSEALAALRERHDNDTIVKVGNLLDALIEEYRDDGETTAGHDVHINQGCIKGCRKLRSLILPTKKSS
jgi:hypothetical protein